MITSLHQSHLGMWARCPQQFRFRYMEGIVMPPGIAARIGTGLHGGAEVANRAKLLGQEEPASVVIEAAVETYKKACLQGVYFAPEEAPSARTQLAEGVDQTAGLARVLHDAVLPGIDPVAIEERLTLDAGLDVPLVGIVDWRDRDPRRWGDFKTAARSWPEGKADQEIQATLYPRLLEGKTGILPDTLEFHVLVKGKKPKHQVCATKRTDDDWRILLERARVMLSMIDAGLFPPAEPGHWICSAKWCGYFFLCRHVPAWRKVLPKKSNDGGSNA